MSKYPGLFLRNRVWYVRKTVPKDLQHLRKSNFKTSLGVSDIATAKKLYHQAMLEIQGKIESLRQDDLKKTAKKETRLTSGYLLRFLRKKLFSETCTNPL